MMKNELSETLSLESSYTSTNWTNDDLYKVKRKENKGHVGHMGKFVISRDCGLLPVLLIFEFKSYKRR